MRLVLGLVAFALCVILSMFLSAKYKERKDFFNDFSFFNKSLIKEVGFGQKTLGEMLNRINNNSYFFVKLKSEIFNIKINAQKNMLKYDEIAYFDEYVSNIGTSDKESQIEYLKTVNEYLKEKVDKTQEEYKKYTALYIKMGILIGLIAFIIII